VYTIVPLYDMLSPIVIQNTPIIYTTKSNWHFYLKSNKKNRIVTIINTLLNIVRQSMIAPMVFLCYIYTNLNSNSAPMYHKLKKQLLFFFLYYIPGYIWFFFDKLRYIMTEHEQSNRCTWLVNLIMNLNRESW
jgi:hypothetical protein